MSPFQVIRPRIARTVAAVVISCLLVSLGVLNSYDATSLATHATTASSDSVSHSPERYRRNRQGSQSTVHAVMNPAQVATDLPVVSARHFKSPVVVSPNGDSSPPRHLLLDEQPSNNSAESSDEMVTNSSIVSAFADNVTGGNSVEHLVASFQRKINIERQSPEDLTWEDILAPTSLQPPNIDEHESFPTDRPTVDTSNVVILRDHVAADNDKRQLACAPASKEDRSMVAMGPVNERVQPDFVCVDEAVLLRRSRYLHEVSNSPLVMKDASPATRQEYRDIVKERLGEYHCRRSADSSAREVVVLTSCRDRPKKALEFVAHHLLMGASRVLILDVGTENPQDAALPSLGDHLASFIDAGVVEIWQPAALKSAEPWMRSGQILDLEQSELARDIFFREMATVVVSREPHANVLVLHDVREILLITANAEMLGVPPPVPASWYPCFSDLLPASNSDSQGGRAALIFPTVEVFDNRHAFDASRSGMELAQFATGNTDIMMSELEASIERGDVDGKVRYLGSATVVASRGRRGAIDPSLSSNFRLRHFEAESPRFVDGATVDFARKAKRFADVRAVRYAARVVITGDSNQRFIEERIDQCYKNAESRAAENGAPLPLFNLAEIMGYRTGAAAAHLFDDLPPEFELKKRHGPFPLLYRDYLDLLGFNVKRTQKQHVISPAEIPSELRQILQPYLFYSADASEPTKRPVLDADITNENFVKRRILIAEEKMLKPLDGSFLRKALGGGDLARSLCPRFVNATVNSSSSLSFQGAAASPVADDTNVTVCIITKKRQKLVVENILFHKASGVGRFIIGDDNTPNDALRRDLKPLIDLGFVEVLAADDETYINRINKRVEVGYQLPFYSRCLAQELERARRENHATAPWVGLIDTDEFAMVRRDDGCLPRAIRNAASTFEATNPNVTAGLVGLQWRYGLPFSTNIFDHFKTQFERLNYSLPDYPNDQNSHCKIFIRADMVEKSLMPNPHGVVWDDDKAYGCTYLDGSRMGCGGFREDGPHHDAGYLLHLHFRTLTAYLQKALDGTANFRQRLETFDANSTATIFLVMTRDVTSEDSQVEFHSFPYLPERIELLEDLLYGGRRKVELQGEGLRDQEHLRLGI